MHQIRAGEGSVRVGETVSNALKRSETEKRGGKTKVFKKGQAESRVGCLKKGELETSYEL